MSSQQQPSNTEPEAIRGSESWSLCIGVDVYDDPAIDNLHYASSDARRLHQFLRAELGYRSTLLQNQGADRFEAAIKRIAEKAQQGDSILVYFAGHGVNAGEDLANEQLLLFPKVRAADLLSTRTAAVSDVRAINPIIAMAERYPTLQWSFLIDACNAPIAELKRQYGASVESRLERGVRLREFGRRAATNNHASAERNWSVITACALNAQAAEITALKQGLFTHSFIAAMQTAHNAKQSLQFDENFLKILQGNMNSTLKLLKLNLEQTIGGDFAPTSIPLINESSPNVS